MMLGTVVRAQTFYEVAFTIPGDSSEYIGLVIYTDEEHCKMRLVGEEELANNEYYEANYICSIDDKQDKDDMGMMLYMPEDDDNFPVFIWSWEKSDYSDINEVPVVAFDIEDEDTWFMASHFQEIQLSDMDEEYISQFYDCNEPEYIMMKNGINLVKEQTMAKKPMSTSTFHLIVTANTEVSDIGQACLVDLNRIKSEFSGVAKVLNMPIKTHVIAGDNYSKESVSKTIEEVSPQKDDVVVFVYSGHGFRFKDQKDYYPCLDLSPSAYDKATENYVMLSDVFKAISEKGARLNIVLSDCCNSEVEQTLPLLTTNSLFSRANTNFDVEKLKALFVNSVGNIIATAASPGEVSWCGSNGGFFTLSIIESLRNQISALSATTPSWDTLIQNAIEAAASKSENNRNCKKQNGVKFVEVKSAKTKS
jgi:hypothetical protein